MKNFRSNRRKFLRRIAGLTAVSAFAGLIHARNEIDQAFAVNGTGIIIGQANSGSSTTSLTSSPAGVPALSIMTTSAVDLSRAIQGMVAASSGISVAIYGENQSPSGTAIEGFANCYSGTNWGVYGWSRSPDGKGVRGYADATTGITIGVEGYAQSSSGIGIQATVGSPSGTPIVAQGYTSQTSNLQEWRRYDSGLISTLSVVNKDGYLGIGTSSPSTAVHVKSSSSNPAIRLENENNFVGQFIYCYSDTTSHIPFFSGRRARGTTTSPAAVLNNDTLMRYGGSGYGATNFPGGNRAILEFRAAENWTDIAQGTYILFSTTPTGGTGTTERMRITAAGEIIPPTDNTGSIGTPSKRWSLVRATTITSGDLLFENGVRATEEGDGLAFMNKSGDKIAVLDDKGNIHIKGDIIKDL